MHEIRAIFHHIPGTISACQQKKKPNGEVFPLCHLRPLRLFPTLSARSDIRSPVANGIMSIMASQTLPLRACIWSALAISALAPVNLAAQSPERQSLALDVRVVRDVTYRNLEPGEDPKKGKTKLDLFLPADR